MSGVQHYEAAAGAGGEAGGAACSSAPARSDKLGTQESSSCQSLYIDTVKKSIFRA